MRDYINVINETNDTVSIKVSFSALIKKEKETGLYVSYCPTLAVYSQGETRKEARENIVEAVELFIEGCIEDDTLEEVLKDCGFSRYASVGSASPKQVARKTPDHTELPPQFAAARKIKIPAEIPMMAHGS